MRGRKNNKGFTLVEILAAVTIMGILAAIAIPAVYRYVTKSRDLSYDSMYNSIYDAVKNYRVNTSDDTFKGRSGPTYDGDGINKLIGWKYLEPLIDPADREKKCTAEVWIYNCVDPEELDTLSGNMYTVFLKCSAHSGNRTFDDTGRLLTNDSELKECLGVSDFVVNEVKMKYNDKHGANYTGKWTNTDVWIGDFSVSDSNVMIDHYEYTFDVNNPITIDVHSFGSAANTEGYIFTTDINKKFKIRAVDVNGNYSDWSEKTYRVRIDKTPPKFTMKVINVSKGFSQKFDGSSSNVYEHSDWVAKGNDDKKAKVKIVVSKDASGIKDDSIEVEYNTANFTTYDTPPNTVSGTKTLKDMKYEEELDDGWRKIKCTVTDKVGNKTTGTIKFKLDTTLPDVTMSLVNKKGTTLGDECKCSKSSCSCSYKDNDSKKLEWLKTAKAYDKVSATDSSGIAKIEAGYNNSGSNTKNNTIPDGNKYIYTGVNNFKSTTDLSDGYRYMEYKVTDQAGNTTKIKYTVKKDSTAPTFTMKIDNVTNGFEKEFKSNETYEYPNWVAKGNGSAKLIITVGKDASGIKSKINVKYNTAGIYNAYNDTNMTGGDQTLTNGAYEETLKDGYRVITCTVTDKAGNKTTGTIKFKLDTTPPKLDLNLLRRTNNTVFKPYSCSGVCDEKYSGWIKADIQDSLKVFDTFSGIDVNKDPSVAVAKYNEPGKNNKNPDTDVYTTIYRKLIKDKNASQDGYLHYISEESKQIAQGSRYIEYSVKDVAGNTTVIKLTAKLDRTPPKIVVVFSGGKVKFTADSTVKTNESDDFVYEYGFWINANNQLTKEAITVEDNISGIDVNNSFRRLYTADSDYDNLKQTSTTKGSKAALTFNPSNNILEKTRTITHDSDKWIDGYRVAKYEIYDLAGNKGTLEVQFKNDKTPPNINPDDTTKTKYVGVTMTYGTSKKQIYNQWLTDTDTTSNTVNLQISAHDDTSGVSGYFNVSYNKAGQKSYLSTDKETMTKYTYKYDESSIIYKDNDDSEAAISKTRTIKNALANGHRYFVVTLRDMADNTKDIKIRINKTSSSSSTDTPSDKNKGSTIDNNPVGCYYYDYYLRNPGYPWGCSCTSTHKSSSGAHFVVCKGKDGKYYGKKGYYRQVKKSKKKIPSPTLICPDAPASEDSSISSGKFTVLSPTISNTIIYSSSIYGSNFDKESNKRKPKDEY